MLPRRLVSSPRRTLAPAVSTGEKPDQRRRTGIDALFLLAARAATQDQSHGRDGCEGA